MPKKHHKHQLTSYVVVIWQFSCIAASSSGPANDIEDSRSPAGLSPRLPVEYTTDRLVICVCGDSPPLTVQRQAAFDFVS